MPKLTDIAQAEIEAGRDSRFGEVSITRHEGTDSEFTMRLRLQRVEAGAALIQGVPALISALPQAPESEDQQNASQRRPRPLSTSQANQLSRHFHGIVCASVCGDWNDETEQWDKITLDPVRHDPANGIIALNWFLPGELMQIVSAVITLQTGKEVGVMLDTLFQGAAAVFKVVTTGALDALRSLDDTNTVES